MSNRMGVRPQGVHGVGPIKPRSACGSHLTFVLFTALLAPVDAHAVSCRLDLDFPSGSYTTQAMDTRECARKTGDWISAIYDNCPIIINSTWQFGWFGLDWWHTGGGYSYKRITGYCTFSWGGSFKIRFYGQPQCGAGFFADSNGACERVVNPKNDGPNCSSTTNPISFGTGNKWQREVDFTSNNSLLSWARTYNSSKTTTNLSLGVTWSHDFERFIQVLDYRSREPSRVEVLRAGGQSFVFNATVAGWQTDTDIQDRLEKINDEHGVHTGWRYTVAHDNSVETYSIHGKLQSITERSGHSIALVYDVPLNQGGDNDPYTLDAVSDQFGSTLRITYDADKRITQVTYPSGEAITYSYQAVQYESDTALNVANLVSVQYPDGRSKTYHYNEPEHTGGANLPHALTGITDENGDRYATYQYQADGRAIATGHAGGAVIPPFLAAVRSRVG